MAQVQLPNSVKRTLNICLILSGIGTFAVIAFGLALINIKNENKITTKFLEVAENTEVNFENSLLVYTEKTRNIIGYLTKLRPNKEEDVISFISQIEEIGQDLGLDVKLETYKDPIVAAKEAKKASTSKEGFITYKLEFFGTDADMNLFLSNLESLPYFIKVENINFKDLDYIEKTVGTQANIKLTIKLYTR